ncbi:uncharacterized protein LOC127719084 [Mytilus californianus]|uniref:uncharacterized protein LOC127719084 n=1 Tax=Mytilus californianus TaxID=6549 RepID=UPI002246D5B3|nr:uncharacterized protein LOC127719084 [Mytilus californianus]
MQNQLELKAVSVRLYKYLCEEVVGSENIVRYRRLYYKIHDDISNNINFEFISSGSKAEGLDLPGSDFDLMFLLKFWEVYEYTPKDKEDVIMLDTKNALPGFALLKTEDKSSFPYSRTKTADGNLISNSDFFNLLWSVIGQDANFFEIHGPSMSHSFLVDTDTLYCLKCHTWPTVAKQWLLRSRPSGWPSQDIISKIVAQGCLLVPVGSKSSCSKGHPFEWRFSFSLSEKLLVHSFNHTQLLCYALLKIWLKEILNSDNILNNKLCSYFLKSVLFWILEEDENFNWIPQNLLHCFLLCIHRLHYWIVCGYFPNYFIPEHNMIDGKLSRDVLAYLSLYLDKMNMRENWKIMFLGPSLRNFRNLPISIQRKIHRLSEFDEAILLLHTIGSLILSILRGLKGDGISASIIYRMIHKHLPNSARKILISIFLKDNKNILTSLHIVNCKNKREYLGYRECLSRMLINTFYDAESGWLLLAAFFYSTQKYNDMSCILQLSSSMFSLKNRFVQNIVDIHSFRDLSKLEKMIYSRSFVKRMRYEIARVFHIDYKDFMTDYYPFVTDEIPKIGLDGGLQPYSSSLFFFLKFLYGHKQGNLFETQSALQLLDNIFEEESEKSTNILCLASSYTLLVKAFVLLNDEEGIKTCTFRFIAAIKKLDIFETLMNYIQDNENIKMTFEIVLKYFDLQYIK